MIPQYSVCGNHNVPCIIFHDYGKDIPAPKIAYQPYQIIPEYEHHPEPETDQLRDEIIQFKANCESEPALKYLGAVEELIIQNRKLKKRNLQLNNLIMEHAEALYSDMASQLLAQIKRSPVMEKELNRVLSQKEYIGLRDLVAKLTESMQDNWVAIGAGENGANAILSFDINDLEILNEQINLLAELGAENGRQQTVLIKANAFKQMILPHKNGWGKTVLTGVLYSGWVTGQVSSFVLKMLLSLTPSFIALLPSLFPTMWLELLKVLMSVIYKK